MECDDGHAYASWAWLGDHQRGPCPSFEPQIVLDRVGSEVERAIRAYGAGNVARCGHAQARALELFELTATDPRWRGPRRREILRAREEFCRLFHASDVGPGSAERLRRYFLAFAIAARRRAVAG